jgi:tellurite resistance protein TehA-like permease
VNIGFYLTLWVLFLGWLILFPQKFIRDLNDPARGVGFFTIVAGTCVLGSQLVVLRQAYGWAIFLLLLGAILWLIFNYVLCTAFTIKEEKASLEKGINGVWLVAVVATQSISVLCGRVVPYVAGHQELILFASFFMFLLGGMLYLIIITLIFYRLLFFPLEPEALAPPYWINMGAAAISTLAGATLILNSPISPFLAEAHAFTLGFTFFFWSFATWWIPLLLLLGAWRYLVRRVKLSYNPQYWSVVFPLGMYTTCTTQLAKAAHLDFLMEIPRYFVYAAILAWALTFWGLLRAFARLLFSADPPAGR